MSYFATTTASTPTPAASWKATGMISFDGNPAKWTEFTRSIRSLHCLKTYTRLEHIDEEHTRDDDTATASDFWESRESCVPEVLPVNPVRPADDAPKAAHDRYKILSDYHKIDSEAIVRRNKSLLEAHSYAMDTFLQGLGEEGAALARVFMANVPAESMPVTFYDLVQDRNAFYSMANPLMSTHQMVEEFMTSMTPKKFSSFKAYSTTLLRRYKEWEASFYPGGAVPANHPSDEKAAAWLVCWLAREWKFMPENLFPLPLRYRASYKAMLSDQNYLGASTFVAKLRYLEVTMLNAEQSTQPATGVLNPSGGHLGAKRGVGTTGTSGGGHGSGAPSSVKPSVEPPQFSKRKLRAFMKESGASHTEIKRAVDSLGGAGSGNPRAKRGASPANTRASSKKHSAANGTKTIQCKCHGTCTCFNLDGEDSESGAETARGRKAIAGAPKSFPRTGRAAGLRSLKVRIRALAGAKAGKTGKTGKAVKAGRSAELDRWPAIIDSGAHVHAVGVEKAYLLKNLRDVSGHQLEAVSAFGEALLVEARGDLTDLVKDVHVVEGVQETLVSVPRLRSEGYWTIIPPQDAGYEHAVFVVRHNDRKVVAVANEDMVVDLRRPVPYEMPPIQLPLLPYRDGPEERDSP